MPPVPDNPELAATIESLSDRVAALNRHMEFLVREKVEAEVAEKAVPREEFTARVRASGRRAAAGMLVLLLLLVTAVGLNRVTLLQAQRDLNTQVVSCFLRPGEATPARVDACTKRFGNGYRETQQRSRNATQNFQSLQEWAKSQGWKPPEKAP
jgi:hypothetical protein